MRYLLHPPATAPWQFYEFWNISGVGLDEHCWQCRCGAREGCLYPNLLADADGSIGVGFRTCDLKARPVTMSGQHPCRRTL